MTDTYTGFIEKTGVLGVYIIKRPTLSDERGFFHEIFRSSEIESRTGLKFKTKQANWSRSRQGVMRGIHIAPYEKIVTVVHGSAQQIVVDARAYSPTFGKYESIVLTDEKPRSVLIPRSCGNAYLALSDQVDYIYLQTEEWQQGIETYVAYNDPDLAIPWMLDNPYVSAEELSRSKSMRELFPGRYT